MAELSSAITYSLVGGLFTCVGILIVRILKKGTAPKPDLSREMGLFRVQLKHHLNQSRRDELTDQLRLVYRPLCSAVLEMKEGKDVLPRGGSVGNVNNPWSYNPTIIAQVVDVFNKHLALIENEEVRKGWEENKEFLRKGEFWYGERERKWLESIERAYNRIKWERDSP